MRHRWKWISALLIGAILGFGLWLRQWQSAPPLPLPSAAAASIPAPLTSAWPASLANSAVQAVRKRERHDEIEVCGVGKVKLEHDNWAAAGNYLDALTKNARLRWLAALRNSDDYRAHAAGLYLEGAVFELDSAQRDPEAARGELLQLALATKDPAIFALAYSKCSGVCTQLILDGWTHADGDNAVPWLALAAQARREGDGTGEAAAMAHAAQAHQYQPYNGSLFSFAQAAMPNDVDATERWILSTQVFGVQAAMPMPHQPLFQYCSRDAQSDAAVHQQCTELAELIVNKAGTLLDLGVGKSLGARVGWSAERVEKATQEIKASLQVMNEMTGTDPGQQWNCDSVARGNAIVSRLDELGERGLARRAIESSAETETELARKFDEWAAAGRAASPARP